MYEIVEHTADLGVHVAAATLAEAFVDAGLGLFAVIAGDVGQIRVTDELTITVVGDDPAWLLFDWLRELLAAFDPGRMLLVEFSVELDAAGLRGTARGERFDPSRHTLAHEVKAITQHAFDLRPTSAGWEATYILDI